MTKEGRFFAGFCKTLCSPAVSEAGDVERRGTKQNNKRSKTRAQWHIGSSSSRLVRECVSQQRENGASAGLIQSQDERKPPRGRLGMPLDSTFCMQRRNRPARAASTNPIALRRRTAGLVPRGSRFHWPKCRITSYWHILSEPGEF